MNNKNTITHTDANNTQYCAHCAPFIDAHWCHIAPVAQVRLVRVIHACAPVCCFLSVLFLVSFVLYLVSLFSFQPFLMSTSALNERSRSNPLCDFRLGTVVTSDYETPLTFTRDRGKRLHKELVSSDRSGKLENSEDIFQACSRWNRGTCEIKRKHTRSERTICSCRTS